MAANAAIVAASKSRRPDASLGVMADAKMTPTLYRPTGSISIPIWRDKFRAQMAQARAEQKAAHARLSEQEISLIEDFAEKGYAWREAGRNLALIKDQLLPKARQSFESARIGYLSGQLDYFNLSDAQRTLFAIEMDEVEVRSRRDQTLTDLSLLAQGISPGGAQMPSSPVGMGSGASNGDKKKGGM